MDAWMNGQLENIMLRLSVWPGAGIRIYNGRKQTTEWQFLVPSF